MAGLPSEPGTFRRVRRLVLGVLLAGALLALPAHADPVPDPVVYIAGDSIVAGVGAPVPARDAFPVRLSAKLCGQQCGKPGHATVISVARGGQRLLPHHLSPVGSSLSESWQSILDATPTPTVIVTCIGINDMGGVDIHVWAAAYRDIAARAQARGIRIVPCLMTPSNGRWSYRPTAEPQRKILNGWLVAYFGAANVADPSAIGLPWDTNTLDYAYDSSDGLHLNPYGQMRLADAVEKVI